MTRSYEQACYVARALDVVGERWTLLIVRELALGPRRYGDLLATLPGIGTSLLAVRLKHLELADVVQRVVLSGASRTAAYELTPRGEALMPTLAGLAVWGAGLGEAPPTYTDRAAWAAVAMRLTAPEEAAGFTTLTELRVGEETLWLQGDGRRVQVRNGQAPSTPGLRLTCDKETFYALGKAQLAVDDAIASGGLVVDGESDAARSFFNLFRLPVSEG
jgi:DNA-binding HxlR family transcriptional regulator